MSTQLTDEIRPRKPSFNPDPIEPVVRVARTHKEVLAAWQLLYRVYRDVGFIDPNPLGIHTVPQAVKPESAVFLASVHGELVGTLTSMGDGPAGLPLDQVFSEELNTFRDAGHRLVEIGLFCTEPGLVSLTLPFQLVRYASYFGLAMQATHFVFGVAPRRVRVYERGLGFRAISDVRSYATVRDNPVVLMAAEAGPLIAASENYRGLSSVLRDPLGEETFSRRYRFDPRSLPASPIGQFLSGKAKIGEVSVAQG